MTIGTSEQESPPSPPPAPTWPSPAPPDWYQLSAAPPPPGEPRRGLRRIYALIAVVVAAAVLGAAAVGAVAVFSGRATGRLPNIAPQQSLPPQPALGVTPPPAAAVHPLPTRLPTGSVIAGTPAAPLAWTSLYDGTVRVTRTGGGVDVVLLAADRRYWLAVPVSSAFQALRLDATVTMTADSPGNHVGLACKTADNVYGATFSMDSSGQWFTSIDWPDGPTLIASAHSAAIRPTGAANTLSIACANSGGLFSMMYAINGSVVADEVSPVLTSQPLLPTLYLCSCYGSEGMRDVGVVVSTLQPSASS